MPHNNIRFWSKLEIPGNPKISMAIAAYNRHDPLACLLYSLKSQTYENWEAIVMHDGTSADIRALVQDRIADPRIRYYESSERKGQYGHPHRQTTIGLCTGDYIGMSNDDNYYAPVYFECMLHALYSANAAFAHCDMVHNYWSWCYFMTSPRKDRCDLGAWVARADLVKSTPWRDMEFAGDGTFINDMVAKCGTSRTVHVQKCLFCHN